MSSFPIPDEPELLAPAGDWECLRAAVANGADAVYFGLPKFNARLRAHNFTEEELRDVVEFCHRHGVKAYVAMNTLVFTGELEAAEEYLRTLSRAGVDAIIVQDVGLVRLARETVPDLPVHASTQMTVTSPEGVSFARELGVERVVLARELSLRELEKFEGILPLEVFVHGALCVAYSGQCLTSESLGQRSANRGECAQACRMPYQLVVDGALRDLGDKRYLLSPQDLAAVQEIPALLERGVTSFKIEGRLKSPEYVAAVCQVYRRALDATLARQETTLREDERYKLEMTFSRGLFTGWMHGVDHQRLVSARFGKKRGPFVGRIARIGRNFVEIDAETPVHPGDGVVFDTGGDTNAEQGGRVYEVRGRQLFFEHGKIDMRKLKVGDRVWKTDDPALDKVLRQSFTGRVEPRRRLVVAMEVSGGAGRPLTLHATLQSPGTTKVSVGSSVPLQEARTAPLGTAKLREHLGRFGEYPFVLGELRSALEGAVILPISELNRMRRIVADELQRQCEPSRMERATPWCELLAGEEVGRSTSERQEPSLAVLCRTAEQIEAAMASGVRELYVDYEDVRRYKDAVAQVRTSGTGTRVILATPRIQKAGEQGFFKLIENAEADGVLIRNLGAIGYFASRSDLKRIGDFSLNVANPLTAQHFIAKGLDRVTISYDLNIEQVLDLLAAAPGNWFEITLHQHMPMFHMEHCVFAAFLSKGSSYLDCGRPCEKHRVHLRDRVGVEHRLLADVGCRNTLFNAVAQTGARFYPSLIATGLERFRVELLEESGAETRRIVSAYQALIWGERDGEMLWRDLQAQNQLGVTRGTLLRT